MDKAIEYENRIDYDLMIDKCVREREVITIELNKKSFDI